MHKYVQDANRKQRGTLVRETNGDQRGKGLEETLAA